MEGTTQGDPAAMAIYAIAIVPMILMLVEISLQRNNNAFTAAYNDDLTAAGPIDQLKKWRDELRRLSSKFGYYPERSKSWLLIKKCRRTRRIHLLTHQYKDDNRKQKTSWSKSSALQLIDKTV